VKNYLDTVEYLSQQLFISDAALDEFEIAANLLEVLTMPGRQIVEHAHACAMGHERRRDV
jgi:hypothetical protein